MVRLLDSRACSQSDVTNAEGEGHLVIYGLVASFKAKKSKVNVGDAWFRVSPPSLSLSLSWCSGLQTAVCLLLICPAVEKFVFLYRFFFWADQFEFSLFFTAKVTDWSKNYFYLFVCFEKFHCYFAMRWSYALFYFEENLSTDNIRWMLSWASGNHYFVCTID